MSFDHLAPHYRWMEAVMAGGLMQRVRTRWLEELRGCKRALLAGEGNGRMLEACAAAMPQCHFTVVDKSRAMLDRAERRWREAGGNGNASFHRGDLMSWRSEKQFDLIVTNFFLDCFAPQELSSLIANINSMTSTSARWLVADFCVPKSGWRKMRAQLGLAVAYGFFRAATGISARHITPPDALLSSADFVLEKREFFDNGLLHADLWVRKKCAGKMSVSASKRAETSATAQAPVEPLNRRRFQ